MEKLHTIQKRNNLNEVFRVGDVGPGGAYHDYQIFSSEKIGDGEYRRILFVQQISFQKGARKDPEARHGVLDNDLLEIVRDRLKAFQSGDFACHENEMALIHLEEALMWMNRRVEDRAEREVLGTYNK